MSQLPKHLDSPLILGCMRINQMGAKDVSELIDTALQNGINFFDHADIYGGGKSEEVFAEALKGMEVSREDLIIQTKCGIRKGYFDFSKEHIIQSVDDSLKRLNTEYLDVLLLHRPDALVEPEEVAESFDILKKSGKVRNFGVSNHNSMQIELLKKYVDVPLLFNQLQLSITNSGMIDSGLNVNMQNNLGINRDDSILDYSRLNDMTIQCWSPFQFGFFEGVFLGHEKYPELNKCLESIASKYNVTPSAVAIAWLLRHPAKMQAIVGTTNKQRLQDISQSTKFSLTREEWYEIYRSAGNKLP